MKTWFLIPLFFVALLSFGPLDSTFTPPSPQGKPKPMKADATYTGKITSWGLADNGSIFLKVEGANKKGEQGSIWVRAEPARTADGGLAAKVLQVILHHQGDVTVEGRVKGKNAGAEPKTAMDLLKIGNF